MIEYLCCIGVHLRGIRTAGCMYNISRCDYCSRDVWYVITENKDYMTTQLKYLGRYNWKGQPERLIYIGKKGSWHQFVKTDAPAAVWCEVLEEDLHMLEETTP